MCHSIFSSAGQTKLSRTQPSEIAFGGERLLVHNEEVKEHLKDLGAKPLPADLSAVLPKVIKLLVENGTFNIEQTSNGLVVAASNEGHGGGYSKYVWLRDLARIYSGVQSIATLDARKIPSKLKLAEAMPDLISSSDQIAVMMRNIVNPQFQQIKWDNVPRIRLNKKRGDHPTEPLTQEELDIESHWSHRQNDALALYGHALLDSVASGDINLAEMSLQKKLSILILASYLQRVDYVTMADSGAWEEGAGIRTSSVASVTSFLERVQEGLRAQSTNENEKQFFNSIFDQTKLTSEARNFLRTFAKSMDIEGPEDIVTTMENSFEHLDGTLDRAYLLFKKRLRRGKLGLVEVEGLDGVGRVDDAALLHTLLYAPARWNVGQRAYLAGRLESSLGRASGVIRYKNDGFLWELGIAYSDKLSQVALESPDQIAVLSEDKRGYRASTREDRDRAYQAHKSGITDRVEGKDLSEAAAIVGENLEAQWAFQDDMLVQIYSQLYIETGRVEYFDKAWRHLVRGLGQISGSNQFTIEGHPMASFRAVEAWVPVRVMVDGQVKTVYFASPNSPLNWAVAEKARGIVMFMKALKLREQNPVRR